jgi:hypothetical protein
MRDFSIGARHPHPLAEAEHAREPLERARDVFVVEVRRDRRHVVGSLGWHGFIVRKSGAAVL